MPVKLLSVEESKSAVKAQETRDIARTASIKEAKDAATRELNDVQARFKVVMAQQRAEHLRQQEEHIHALEKLQKEITAKKAELEKINAQIDASSEREDTLTNLLQEKIDSYTEKESALEEREKRCFAREQAIADQFAMIKTLSSDLTDNLKDKLSRQ